MKRWSLHIAMFTFLLALRALAAAEIPTTVLEAEAARIASIQKATRSAVAIFANDGNGGGSGVVISPDGYALTNYHVVQPAGVYMKCGLADGRLYDAVLVGIDPTGDVALIKLLGREDFTPAIIANSDDVKIGDWCFAVGNPFLLATDFQPTVTYGIVSGTHRYQPPAGTLLEYTDCIQTDASINPGNSGGPLFNAAGDLIGINGRGSFEKRGRVNVGVGYAISINQVQNFLGCLKSGRIVDHATLGATVAMSDSGAVRISDILESSDAYRRGLRYEDQLVSFAGRPIDTPNGFKNVLGIFPKGWRVPLVYRRGGVEHSIVVRLTGVHAEEELIELLERKPKVEEPEPGKRPAPGRGKPRDGGEPAPKPVPGEPAPPKAKKTDPHAEPEIPPEAKKLIQARMGFANYYFNELGKSRVWSAAQKEGDFSSLAGTWTLSGEIAGGGKVKVTLEDGRAAGDFVQGSVKLEAGQDLDKELGPPGSGGLLAALYLWRHMLVHGPQKFGEVYYYGTAPHRAVEKQAEVLIGTRNVAETTFVFDPATGRLAAAEMALNPDADSCELVFSVYRELNGRQVPYGLEVRRGDSLFAKIQWNQIELAQTGPEKP